MGRIESVNPAACSRFRAILHYKTSRSRNWHRARQYLRLRKAIRGQRHDLQRDRSRYDSKSLSTAICSHEGRALGKRSRQAVASGYRARSRSRTIRISACSRCNDCSALDTPSRRQRGDRPHSRNSKRQKSISCSATSYARWAHRL